MRLPRIAWVAAAVIVAVTVLRAAFAASLPLTGDEAYYWEWSRRLAAGYTDHPPAVAFAIAAFAWLGRDTFAVRIAFVLCGAGAAFFLWGAANRFAGDKRAGPIAALLLTLAPMMTVAFGMASPDGPYALTWAATLYCASRLFTGGDLRWAVWTGVAMGLALETRLFALALPFGIVVAACMPEHRRLQRGTWLALAVALLLWMPYLAWNATHAWIGFRFALLQRHEPQISLVRPLQLYALCALAFAPGIWIAATYAAIRLRTAVLAWTALPFAAALFILAWHERVEVYWFIGPFISLCAGVGSLIVELPERKERGWILWSTLPAAALTALIFVAGLAPGGVYTALRATGIKLSDGGPFEMFTYPHLARDVRAITARHHAVAMTDGYGFSSLLDFYGRLTPVVIGYDPQGEQARTWYTRNPGSALFVDKVPLKTRPDFVRQLALGCGRVLPGPVLSYAFRKNDPQVPPRRYYTTWCLDMSRSSVAILRWQQKS